MLKTNSAPVESTLANASNPTMLEMIEQVTVAALELFPVESEVNVADLGPGLILHYRVKDLYRRMERLERWRREVDAKADPVEAGLLDALAQLLDERVLDLTAELDALVPPNPPNVNTAMSLPNLPLVPCMNSNVG